MPQRIGKQSAMNARKPRVHSVVMSRLSSWHVLAVLMMFSTTLVLTGCAPEEPVKKPKRANKQVHLTGDWYDEYAEEKKQREPSLEDKRLYSNPRECLKAAELALSKKNHERAYELANQVLKSEPNNAKAHFIRGAGTFYSAFGEEKDAINDLEMARQLGYKSGELYTALAKLYDARHEYDKAIEVVSYGIKVKPDKDLMRCRASLYETVGKRDEALKDLNEYIRLAPDKSIGYYLRANLYQQVGRDEDALADYLVCIKKNPDSTFAMTERARLFLKLGREQDALKEISRVTDTDKSDDDAIRLRGNIYLKLGQNDRAIADYTQAIKLSPDYARANLEARAAAYDKIGKKDLARQDREQAARLKEKPAEKPVYEFKE
jgi:tetratricopeptide (TPR) repeat protein